VKPSRAARMAVLGTGGAAQACACQLLEQGHHVTLMVAREGPVRRGIVAAPADLARAEARKFLHAAGMEIRFGLRFGQELSLAQLQREYDGVCLAMGAAGFRALHAELDRAHNIFDLTDFLHVLRGGARTGAVRLGRHVVVIGGADSGAEAAVQAKSCGANQVTWLCDGAPRARPASAKERFYATSKSVRVLSGLTPCRSLGHGAVEWLELIQKQNGARLSVRADQIVKPIGMALAHGPEATLLPKGVFALEPREGAISLWQGGNDAEPCRRDGLAQAEAGRIAAVELDRFFNC
ncbi:MAG: FAD-dependent oxidoreductase, partial [Mangrovicoccus sp.]|nr:FAD-dependent oxidoreductase [Mangrovicoccus sp.]